MRLGLACAVDLRDGVGEGTSGSNKGGGKEAVLSVSVRAVDCGGGENRTDGEGREEGEVVVGEESSGFIGEVKSIFLLTLWLDKGLRA